MLVQSCWVRGECAAISFSELSWKVNENVTDGYTDRIMRQVLPQNLDWPSFIGIFIMNFGQLDLELTDVLKRRLPEERWNTLTKESFHERVLCLGKLAGEQPEMIAQKQQWDSLIHRLKPLRDFRNFLAHSTLVHTLSEDGGTWTQTLSFTGDVSASKDERQRVTFEVLLSQATVLADVIGELHALGR